ncbi:ADP-ribosylglycohydrolase family protein [Gemmata sp. JC717]|uniref:ADP-ribosylglycohydrolase family protein n=1 Tax=Gemmata algarum TaxID=2975278 RepID=UPI0021BBAA82|nr:ADP-ribosylglycohydrolase family protein [Gemmata algarum]MDY3556413.1 ADP-ribosylglycohydrolase family protein [Gemmata algarum]
MGTGVADRVRGVLFGQAVGDALGFGTEFLSRTDVKKHFPFGLQRYAQLTRLRPCPEWQPGDWTDDTDQMLCICDSLLAHGRFELLDIAARIRHWATADGFGVDQVVYTAARDRRFLTDPHAVAQRYWEANGRVAANGGVMRTSVLGVWGHADPRRVRQNAEEACRLTHADPRCVGSCVAVCLAVRELLLGEDDMNALTDAVSEQVREYHPELADCLSATAAPSLEAFDLDEGLNPNEPDRAGDTLKALGAGFWALRNAHSFQSGISHIIHEGGDADANAAVAGALLGARFGAAAIPAEWRQGLVYGAQLETRVQQLLTHF